MESLVHPPDAGRHGGELRLRAAPRASPSVGPRLRNWASVTAAIAISLGRSAFFKYFGFFEENLNQVLGWLGCRPDAGPGGRPADRDLVLHVPRASATRIDVYRGTAPAGPVVRRLRLLHRPVPAARSPARSSATTRSSAQLVSRGAHLGEVRLGVTPLHPRLRQEDPARQPDGPRGRRGLRRPVARRLPTPGSARSPTRSRSTSISPAIPTWPWAWAGCSASSS